MFKGDEVIFQKKRRFRYTCLEERKMWHFFVRELKAQNPDALRKRITLWEMYEGEERTTKKMFGLESHFRKYMLPRINHAAVPREDLFLLLRFFRAHLTTAQRKELEHLHDCEIKCERNGIFLRARIENKAGEFFFPTQEQESTILRPLDDEDQSEGAKTEGEEEEEKETVSVVAESVYGDDVDIDEEEREGAENHPPRRQTPSIERNGTTTKSNGPNKASKSNNVDKRKDNVAQNTHSGWISKALLSRPPLSRPPKRKRNNRDTTTVIVLEQDGAVDKGQEQNKSGNGHEKNNTGNGQERSNGKRNNTGNGQKQGNNAANRQVHERDITADVLGSGNASPLARSTPQPMDQENEQSCSNRLSSLLPQLVSPVEQPDNATKVLRKSTSHVVKTHAINTAKMKRHFLAGSLKLLDGKMNLDAFVRPFTGGKFEKGVRSIAWFAEKA
ncbi:hypothetical protein niasHT_036503 [Heterodera trifolii]|uniref:Uncharacterized protein n=1 Tax=Heterodera trifolii TaxID=157864 RepID=A0ABD2IVH6_9BILA